MWGAIIGDIVGSRFEFMPGPIDKNFELFTEASHFTDDTVCTIAFASAILAKEANKIPPFKGALIYWCKKYPLAGYGERFEDWIYSDDHTPYKSKGNGALMRVSPIAEYYNYNSMLRVVYKGTEITHNTAEAIFLAEMVAELIYLGKKGWNLKEAIDKVKEKYSDFLYNFNSKESVELARNTIPLVLQTLEEAENFEDVIRIAVSFGGDTDTVACVAGSIAEFYYLIPEEMIKKAKTYLPKEMINVIEKFYLQF